jgi:hypothetical protein
MSVGRQSCRQSAYSYGCIQCTGGGRLGHGESTLRLAAKCLAVHDRLKILTRGLANPENTRADSLSGAVEALQAAAGSDM